MKCFITAMLTLALTTAFSSETAFAQDRMQPQTQLRDNGYFTGMVGKWHIGYEPAGQVYAAHRPNSLTPVASSFANTDQVDCFAPSNVDRLTSYEGKLPLAPPSPTAVGHPNDYPEVMNPSGSSLHHTFVDYFADPDCPDVVDPYLQNDNPLLPWHGR